MADYGAVVAGDGDESNVLKLTKINPDTTPRSFGQWVVIFCVIAVVAMAAFTDLNFSGLSNFGNFKKVVKKDSSLSWTLYRSGYSPLPYLTDSSTFLKYSILEGNVAVIEPYTDMFLYVDGYDESASTQYELSVCNPSKLSAVCLKGSLKSKGSNPVMLECEPYDVYELTVTEYDSDTDEATGVSSTGTATCLYVRREIRALTPEHLGATMDAMATLWHTTEEQGQALYGSNFHNSSFLAAAHFFGASHQVHLRRLSFAFLFTGSPCRPSPSRPLVLPPILSMLFVS